MRTHIIWTAGAKEPTVVPFTEQEELEEDARQFVEVSNSIREQRDALLIQSDWTQLPDAPVDSLEWAIYRKNLREITDQPGFPYNILWPTAPSGV